MESPYPWDHFQVNHIKLWSVLKTSGILRFFLVKHQSSSHVFWVIQNVSDNKLDDTQKAPVSLRNRKPLKPLGLSSWLSKKSHNSPWYSDTPFQTKSLCIAKAPTQTIIGSLHNFPPTKAGLYNKHGPIFCNPNNSGVPKVIFSHKWTKVPRFQVFFEKNPEPILV